MHPLIEQEMVRQQQAGLGRDEQRQELLAEARASRASVESDGGAGPGSAHESVLHHVLALILHPRTPHDPAH